MSNFNHSDNYTPNAGISGVVYGSETPILEVELNEMQLIQQKRFQDFLKTFVGSVISDKSAISYSSSEGVVSVSECDIIVEGVLIHCTGLSTQVTEGSVVYLKVWEDVVDSTSTLKEEGNEQSSTTVTNNIKDSRYDFTTSKRRIYKYTLALSSSEDSALYAKLCTITDGSLVVDIRDSQVALESELVFEKLSGGSFNMQVEDKGSITANITGNSLLTLTRQNGGEIKLADTVSPHITMTDSQDRSCNLGINSLIFGSSTYGQVKNLADNPTDGTCATNKNYVDNVASGKANVPTTVTMTMSASSWSDSQYSFESEYPSSDYDMTIEINGSTATSDMLDAWSSAKICGNPTSNIAIAKGDVPEIDIDIIVKVVRL